MFVLYVLYLFFFKQKTAYEVRISDWSSDVCSSDLQMPAFEAMMPAHVALTVAQDRTPSIRASLHEAEITLLIAVVLVTLVVLLFLGNWRAALKIGSASCRERVCQYV